nr:hypothetical protein [Tanacetum cinerariifolium]
MSVVEACAQQLPRPRGRDRADNEPRGENEPSPQPKVSIENLSRHIKNYGFDPSYKTWIHHGKPDLPSSPPVIDNTRKPQMSDMTSCLNDLSYIPLNNEQIKPTQEDICETSNELTQAKCNEFKELYASANEELYPSCDYVTRLDFMAKFTYFKMERHNTPGKKVPKKVLRYFSIIPRLQRLYKSSHTAKNATGKCTEPGKMQDPVDGRAWKNFDTKLQRLYKSSHTAKNATGKCTEPGKMQDPVDGRAWKNFDTKNLSQSYSMWPVILTTYNLPSWLCMKESSFMLTLLIPGPKSLGKDIDVYLRPLIDDLKDLWAKPGVETIDVATGQKFNMRAMVLWTINDFIARSSLPGWSGKGYKACPTCNKDTPSVCVLGKTAYVGHIRFLKKPNKWRRSLEFNGEKEDGDPPREFGKDQIHAQLARLPTRVNGKHPSYGDVKIKRNVLVKLNWTERSIFYEIEYWYFLTLKHNLDIMHIEKNMLGSIFNTLLMNDKSKDTAKARQDLKRLGIRSGLWLSQNKRGNARSLRLRILSQQRTEQSFVSSSKELNYQMGSDPTSSTNPEIDTYRSQFKSKFPNKDMKEGFPYWLGSQAKGESFKDDQYILATQVKQVFYLEDMARRPPNWKVAAHVNHKKFLNGGVIVVEDDPDVIHFDNSSNLALFTSLNDLDFATLHIDGQLTDVDAPPDIIYVDEDDAIINDEDALPHDLADFDDEDLVNLMMMMMMMKQGHPKTQFGWQESGRLHTRQKTRNLGLKKITDGELIRELPMYYPSWRQTQFDLKPHMEFGRWPKSIRTSSRIFKRSTMAKVCSQGTTLGLKPRDRDLRQPCPVCSKSQKPGKESLAAIRDQMMESSATQEYQLPIQPFFQTHTVGGVFSRDEDQALYEGMLRLQGLGSNTETGVSYIEDEIMAIVRKGKQRGHLPGFGRVFLRQGTDVLSPPLPPCTYNSDVVKLKKSNKRLTKQVSMIMKLFRSDDKMSQILMRLEPQPEFGSDSRSGGCGDDEPGNDEDDSDDEDDEEDGDR